MPSPFPGMDPYLEDPDLWPDVHHGLISGVSEQLNAALRPSRRYVARVELRTFVFGPDDPAEDVYIIPDARIVERAARVAATRPFGGVALATATRTATPIDITGLLPRTARERYIEIRDASDRSVVTVIEIVSPSNKRVGSAGLRAFQRKRDDVGASDASWFEIDLLRHGTPTLDLPGGTPRTAYRAYTNRTTADGRRQLVWPIRLREPLPILMVPLRPAEPDVPLDLQAALDAAYDRAAYDADTDYGRPPVPPLDADDAAWAAGLLAARAGAGPAVPPASNPGPEPLP